ncbi:hypothetical protein GGI1_14064 [Acidithiobacillus sp. GGI-221]|nr:hypothetical protein GGI1_14064 [Acidithiobacillus sp. GGI-221]
MDRMQLQYSKTVVIDHVDHAVDDFAVLVVFTKQKRYGISHWR